METETPDENKPMGEEKGKEKEKEETEEVSWESEEKKEVEEKEEDNEKEDNEDNREKGAKKGEDSSRKQSSRKPNRGSAEKKEPMTPGSDRPTRERKVVERYSVPSVARSSTPKPLSIEKVFFFLWFDWFLPILLLPSASVFLLFLDFMLLSGSWYTA